MRIAPSLIGLLLLVSAAQAAAQDDVGRETLAGLGGVRVFAERVNPDTERDGVTTSGIQTQVELLLRQAGIRVLTMDEWHVTPGRPMLRLALTVARNQLSTYGFNLDVALLQGVALTRDPSIITFSDTWTQRNIVQLAATTALRTAVRDAVQDQAEAFVNAYLAANPKR